MSSKENKGVKKVIKAGPRSYSKGTFESSLRKYHPSPSSGTKQCQDDVNSTASSADLNVTTWSWKKNKTPTLSRKVGLVSTPATSRITSLTCDASAIEADQSCLPLIKEPLRMKSKLKAKFPHAKSDTTISSNKKTLPVLVLPDDSRRKERAEEDLANAEINILYSEYIQAVFLESKAKRSLAEQDRCGLENLQKMWKANQIVMMQEKSLSGEVELIQTMNQLIEYCVKEERMAEPVAKILPEIMCQYKEISDSVDTIRHKLYTPAVIDPSDFEEDISEIVQHVNTFLTTLFDKLSYRDSSFTEVADLLSSLERLMKEISCEVKRCLKLMAKAKSLTITETSLKIGGIQTSCT